MPDVRQAWRPRHQDLHLEQFDERLGAGSQARLFEQRLFLERFETKVLRQRVHQILSDIDAGIRGSPALEWLRSSIDSSFVR